MQIIKPYKHIQTAHCENGVTTGLLQHHGVSGITEPLAFGIGAGLFYIHIPFITFNNGPAISFRTLPGNIFKHTCRSLGIEVKQKRFKDTAVAQQCLDDLIKQGIPVGCQVGVFHLSYFPAEYRFHFNAHNIIIFGKENGEYLISDPTMETTHKLTEADLEKVRFAKGMFAPKGHLYYIDNIGNIDNKLIKKGIIKGIRRNTRDMLHIPGNIAGVKGIRYTAGKVRKLRDKLGVRHAGFYLGQIVRMQEEIGTGGGGFRFVYASFLEQAAAIFNDDRLISISEQFTRSGDLWRTNAVNMAAVFKGRLTEQKQFDEITSVMQEISEVERNAFKALSKLKLKA